jgi:hypothetical protein
MWQATLSLKRCAVKYTSLKIKNAMDPTDFMDYFSEISEIRGIHGVFKVF